MFVFKINTNVFISFEEKVLPTGTQECPSIFATRLLVCVPAIVITCLLNY